MDRSYWVCTGVTPLHATGPGSSRVASKKLILAYSAMPIFPKGLYNSSFAGTDPSRSKSVCVLGPELYHSFHQKHHSYPSKGTWEMVIILTVFIESRFLFPVFLRICPPKPTIINIFCLYPLKQLPRTKPTWELTARTPCLRICSSQNIDPSCRQNLDHFNRL